MTHEPHTRDSPLEALFATIVWSLQIIYTSRGRN